jgi:hypothetical protein
MFEDGRRREDSRVEEINEVIFSKKAKSDQREGASGDE